MGNLISLFLGSMLPTEPETSNPCKITFLEHSCSTQVQQTPLPMPVLGSTPLLGQKRFHLGHKVPDEYCFQSQAEKVLRRKQFLPFSKKMYLASYSRPETEQVQPLRAPSCHSSATTAVKPSWGIWGVLQMYLSEHTHHGGSCVSPCYLLLETESGTEIPHQAKSCGVVHTTADLLNDWCCYHTSQADKA